ncbi:MAG: DUF3086 domain-containing protein [Pseudanabaenaceae cyanobacterium bins.39]|nr:DUF3086 domain-containing protein [Pseudanabaenaceae cyanobacterium bins.39]
MESDQLPVAENFEETISESIDPSATNLIPQTHDHPPEDQHEENNADQDVDQSIEAVESIANSGIIESLDNAGSSDISIEANALPLDEEVSHQEPIAKTSPESEVQTSIDQLKQEEQQLKDELAMLKTTKAKVLQDQLDDLQAGIIRLSQADIARLEYQKQELQSAIAVLEKRKERLEKEMTSTYAGNSQDIAIRVQGFKDYLVGSLQDLVASAEKLNLIAPASSKPEVVEVEKTKPKEAEPIQLSAQTFAEYRQRVEQLLERYRTLPDYYGPAWKLRRTFEQVHADRVSKWFFEQSGRGAIRTMGTRLQNILVTSAAISILKAIYGEKLRILVLATSPERLGEWRRGFQDCLGLTREQFGSEKGIALFEDPEPLATKGDRLVKEELMPLVVIDESEEFIAVDLLRFPLLIAFGGIPEARPAATSSYMNNNTSNSNYGNRDSRDIYRDSSRDSDRNLGRDSSRDYPREPARDNRSYNRDYSDRNRNYSDRGYGGRNADSDWDF